MRYDYAMFTPQGNREVQKIVETVQDTKLKNNDAWSLAYNELDILSQREGFTEAMDTDVRDHVYFTLNRLNIINELEVDFSCSTTRALRRPSASLIFHLKVYTIVVDHRM